MSEKSQNSNRLKMETGSGPVSVVGISTPAASMAGVPSVIANPTNLPASVKPIPQHVVIQPTILSTPLPPGTQNARPNFMPNVPTSFRIPLQNTSEPSKTSGVFKSTIITSGVSPGQTITGANATAISLANVAVNSSKQFSQVSTIVTLEQMPKVGKLSVSSKIQISTSSTNSTANIPNMSLNQQNSFPIKTKAAQPILVTPGIRPNLRHPNNFAQTIPINNSPQNIKASFLPTQHKQTLRGLPTSSDNPITIVTRPLTQQVIKMQPNAIRPPIMVRPALMAGIRTIPTPPGTDNMRRTNTIVQQPKTAISLMTSQVHNSTSDIHSIQNKTATTTGIKTYHVPSSSSIQVDKTAKILVTQPISTTSISVPNMIVPMVTVVSNPSVPGNTSAISSSNTALVSIAQNRVYHQNKTSVSNTISTLSQSAPISTITTATIPQIPRSVKQDGLTRTNVSMPRQTMIANISSTTAGVNSPNPIWNPHLISSAPASLASQSSARQMHNNVVIIENPSNQRQMQQASAQSGESRHSAGSHSPHPSPKPTILRRPARPDNNSHVLKKINFDAPNIRGDHINSPKKGDQRSVSAITHLQTNQSKVRQVIGGNEISVIHPNAKAQVASLQTNTDGKNKVLYGKPAITSNGFVSNMKLTAKTTKIITKTTSSDGKVTQLTKYPQSREIKIKTESPIHAPNDSKLLEKTSASQLLQNQYHYHPNMMLSGSGPTHMTGYPIKTNAILANQSSRSPHINSSHIVKPAYISRSQPQIIRPTATLPQNISSNGVQYNHNQRFKTEYEPGKRNLYIPEQSKENISQVPHQNHRVMAGQRRPMDDQNQMAMGLSPRKRPRKQTHVISQDPPDVEMIEDDFSTDDADECTDEPQIIHARQQVNHDIKPSISTTPSVKLPGHQPSAYITPNMHLKEPPPVSVKQQEATPLAFNSIKPPTEYIDADGVRYVQERKRPPITLHSRLRFNWKTANNHYLNHNDIRIKPEKRVNFGDIKKPKSNGLKIAHIAQQFVDLSNCENEILKRLENIRDGLENHRNAIEGNSDESDPAEILSALVTQSPGPGSTGQRKSASTPQSMTSSFDLITMATKPTTPTTPLTAQQRKMNRICDEISKTKELSEANIQRCRYVSEKETESKTLLVKSLNHKNIINKLLENHSSTNTENSLSTKRTSKKKYS